MDFFSFSFLICIGSMKIIGMEQEILLKLTKGDHQAFKEIFRSYYLKVRMYLLGFLKDEDEAEELTQVIFIKLWDKREIFLTVQNFDLYLFKLVKNSMLNFIKAKQINRLGEGKFIDGIDMDTPYENLVAVDLQLLIQLTVDKMPAQRKEIFRLSRQCGLSNDEIAQKLGIQKKTVENHLNLALKELRKVIYMVGLLYSMLID